MDHKRHISLEGLGNDIQITEKKQKLSQKEGHCTETDFPQGIQSRIDDSQFVVPNRAPENRVPEKEASDYKKVLEPSSNLRFPHPRNIAEESKDSHSKLHPRQITHEKAEDMDSDKYSASKSQLNSLRDTTRPNPWEGRENIEKAGLGSGILRDDTNEPNILWENNQHVESVTYPIGTTQMTIDNGRTGSTGFPLLLNRRSSTILDLNAKKSSRRFSRSPLVDIINEIPADNSSYGTAFGNSKRNRPRVTPKATAIKSRHNHLIPRNGKDLLRRVLLKPIRLQKFQYLESEIKFLDVVSDEQFAKVFLISCKGESFHLKIHKYKDQANHIETLTQYPRPNADFERESIVYANTTILQNTSSSPMLACYGYVELSQIPQVSSQHPRHPSRAARFISAAYDEFVAEDEDKGEKWRRYFQNAPPSACILRGIVLEPIDSHSVSDHDFRDLCRPGVIFEFGRRALKRLHDAGVLQGKVDNLNVARIVDRKRIAWSDFSSAKVLKDFRKRDFKKWADRELKLWESCFREEVRGSGQKSRNT